MKKSTKSTEITLVCNKINHWIVEVRQCKMVSTVLKLKCLEETEVVIEMSRP